MSSFWAAEPAPVLKTFLSLSLTFVFACLLFSCLVEATPQLISIGYRIVQLSGFLFILLFTFHIFVNIFYLEPIRGIYDLSTCKMKPIGSMLGLAAFVASSFFWINNRKIFSIFAFIFIFILIRLTLCQTAIYSLFASLGVFAFSYYLPFLTTRIAMISTYTFAVLSPLLFVYAFPPSVVIDSPFFQKVLNTSLFHRFLGWEYYSKMFFGRPLLGWGVESSRHLYSESEIVENYCNLTHPHNSSLQAYVELGFAGGIIFALFFASLFWIVERHVKDRFSVAVCNATLITAFIELEITHSLWHNYWTSWSVLVAGFVFLFIKAREVQLRELADHSKLVPAH